MKFMGLFFYLELSNFFRILVLIQSQLHKVMSPRKQKKLDDFYLRALDEMFRRVGFEGYDKSFTQDQWWYTKREWTLEEEVTFTKWMIDEYRKVFRTSKDEAKEVVSMFIFNYGWKIQKMYDKVDGFVR